MKKNHTIGEIARKSGQTIDEIIKLGIANELSIAVWIDPDADYSVRFSIINRGQDKKPFSGLVPLPSDILQRLIFKTSISVKFDPENIKLVPSWDAEAKYLLAGINSFDVVVSRDDLVVLDYEMTASPSEVWASQLGLVSELRTAGKFAEEIAALLVKRWPNIKPARLGKLLPIDPDIQLSYEGNRSRGRTLLKKTAQI